MHNKLDAGALRNVAFVFPVLSILCRIHRHDREDLFICLLDLMEI